MTDLRTPLPANPDLDHLKKQAKHLLRDARAGEAAALHRFLQILPAVRNVDLSALAQLPLQLHDAQSVLARENGFQSWTELKRYVEWKQIDRAERLKTWLVWVDEGNSRERRLAVRMLREQPELFAADPWLACSIGDHAIIEQALDRDPSFANRPGGPLNMPPLVAVTRSRLILEPDFETPLLTCARLLLDRGASPDSSWINPKWPDPPQSALYGAAGGTHHADMTALLLNAGANPNDNESLYHSVESRHSTCTRLLLDAGVRVAGTNAINHVLDYDKLDDLKLLLHHGNLQQAGAANEKMWFADSLHFAMLRGRSLAHIQALIDAGADLHTANKEGIDIYRWAQMHGRTDVVQLLSQTGIEEPLTEEEQFIAACARGDEAAARSIHVRIPEIFSRLTPRQLETMPQLADTGDFTAVRTMLALGWPLEVKTGWGATALHHAIYRGDAPMAELLLQHGASWQALNGFGGNVLGTLSHASGEATDTSASEACVACAKVLIAHGVPVASLEGYHFFPEVEAYFDAVRLGVY